jgi:hypothetical protein
MTGTGKNDMRSRGARYLTLAFLSLQLIAAMTIARQVHASPQHHRSVSVALPANASIDSTTQDLSAARLTNGIHKVSPDLKLAQLNSGILLTGRNWNVTLTDGGLPSLNPFVSNGRFNSICRSFLVGHLIKNSLHKDTPQTSSR